MDAITLLKNDHQTVEKLFKRFEQAGERAHTEKRNTVDRIIEELSVHAGIEETLFYPVTRETVPDVGPLALESLEEHHIVKILLAELQHMDPTDERFTAKVTVLIENVRHHVEEEEQDFFPKVRDALGRNALNDLGDAMVDARSVVPTHPHPDAPDTPPGNLVAGMASGVADRLGDTVSGIAQGSLSAAQDLIARITGSPKPRRAPTGSPSAKKVAEKVRADVDEAAEAARTTGKATVRSASSGARRTGRAAKAGAVDTGRTAKKAASRTTRTAKQAASSRRA